MNSGFILRPVCELCGCTQPRRLLARPMTDPCVLEFLQTYYQGRIDEALLAGADYEILRCPECGFAWQGQVLNDGLMVTLYQQWISAEDSLAKKVHGDAGLYWRYAQQARQIARHVGKRPGDIDVLDFGMGWGYWCRMAQAFGYQVVGLEMAEDRLAHARALGVTAFQRIPEVAGRRFDFINAEQVFEHIREPLQVARSLCSLLRAGGILRIGVPDAAAALGRLGEPGWKAGKDALHPLEHINAFTHGTLLRLGTLAGMDLLETRSLRGRILAALRSGGRARGTTLLFRKS